MWKTLKLADIVDLSIGKTPSRKNPKFWDKEKKTNNIWVSIADITSNNGLFLSDSKEYISDQGAKLFKAIPEKTLIMSFKLSIGKLAITNCELRTNEAIAALEIKNKELVLQKYLFYFLSSIDWSALAGNDLKLKGMTLNKAKLKEIPISFPPLEQQKQIVVKLEDIFSEIDKNLEKVSQIKKNTSDLFEKFLDEISEVKAPEISLKEVSEIKAKLVNPQKSPYLDQKHIGAGNMESMSNEVSNILTAKEEGLISEKFPFDTNSVLYSKIRPYLRKVHLPSYKGLCSADIYPLVPDPSKLKKEYLYYLLLSRHFTNYAMSGSARSGMPKVNRNHLFDYKFPLPSIEFQKAYLDKIKIAYYNISILRKNYGKKLIEFTKLKSSILLKELQHRN